jgi:iron complex transport system ATP-binding protein
MNPLTAISLTLEDLTVRYPRAAGNALERITLHIRGGELLALAGPNGSGKTTLLRAASGSLAPCLGKAVCSGQSRPMHALPPQKRARWIAAVPQMTGLPSGYTVFETVMMGRIAHHGWFGPESAADREAVRSAIAAVGLDDAAGRRIETLSGGMQQRVLIARALAQEAPVLLMDEPTAHLDLRYQIETLSLLRRFACERGYAVAAAMHDLNLASRFADRIALLSEGRLAGCGTPREILTAGILSTLFRHPMQVVPHPSHGYPLVLPDGGEAYRPRRKLRQSGKRR